MADPEDIQLNLGVNGESPEEPSTIPTEVEEEIYGGETQNSLVQMPRFSWKTVLFGIWVVMLCGVTADVLVHIATQQSLTAQLQNMAKTTKQLQMKNHQLKQLLNSTCQNVKPTWYNSTLSANSTQLGLLLEDALQEKAQLQLMNDELNANLESCHLVGEENRKLNLLQNRSMQITALTSAENQQLHVRLNNEQQKSAQLEEENRNQLSILSSSRLSFLWNFCSNESMQCSRCIPGWVEHASRCFFLSKERQKWENARVYCMDMGGDLATVKNGEDQAFLTNLTYQYQQTYPENFHSAWIGLQDLVMEGQHRWVSGHKVESDLIYWKPGEPNNASPRWDIDKAGQDCVAIVPPADINADDWLNSWDDIVCVGTRHYICETMALS